MTVRFSAAWPGQWCERGAGGSATTTMPCCTSSGLVGAAASTGLGKSDSKPTGSARRVAALRSRLDCFPPLPGCRWTPVVVPVWFMACRHSPVGCLSGSLFRLVRPPLRRCGLSKPRKRDLGHPCCRSMFTLDDHAGSSGESGSTSQQPVAPCPQTPKAKPLPYQAGVFQGSKTTGASGLQRSASSKAIPKEREDDRANHRDDNTA